jgi:probable F420-dependent oxidoreductase
MHLALSVPIGGAPLTEAVDLAVLAERLGFREAWSSEIDRCDAVSILAAIAARTSTLELGAGVVAMQTRPAALLAMSASAVAELSGGRFHLGLGVSTPHVVEDWMGLEHRPSLARMRATIEAVRLAMTGMRVDVNHSGVRVRGFRIQAPEPVPFPILIGALGPEMQRLAGSLADGLVLSHVGREALPMMLEAYHQGLAETGGARERVVHRVGVVLGQPHPEHDAILRRELATYGRAAAYRRSFARQGFGAEATALARAWAARDHAAAARAISPEMLAQLFVRGNATACRAAIAEYDRGGVTTLVVIPIALDEDPAARAETRVRTLRAIAPDRVGTSA